MLEFVLTWLKDRWHSPSAAWVLAAVGVIGTLYLWPEIASRSFTYQQILSSIFVGSICVAGWWYANRLPKISSGNLGFAIAISAEAEKERNLVSADFVSATRSIFEELGTTPSFQVIELPAHQAAKITDVKSAEDYRKKTVAIFYCLEPPNRDRSKAKTIMF